MTGLTGLLRASLAGALLLCGLSAQAADCPADRIDEQVRAASVADGDTLRLDDGRKVRLIGVNAPERAHDGRPADPFADEAHALLQRLVREHGGRLGLRLGEESRDRHGRLLAQAYLPDGASIEARLLSAGLATRVAIPPNVHNQDCLTRAEDEARRAGRGVWSLPAYRQPVEARALPPDAQGYMLLQGRVERVGGSRHAQWINLEGEVALKVDHDLLPWFEGMDLKRLQGKRIEARGWLTRPGGKEPRIRLTHPSMIRIID
ncbi:MAG: thermonuclease family protein [Pseudomonadota bacterium]